MLALWFFWGTLCPFFLLTIYYRRSLFHKNYFRNYFKFFLPSVALNLKGNRQVEDGHCTDWLHWVWTNFNQMVPRSDMRLLLQQRGWSTAAEPAQGGGWGCSSTLRSNINESSAPPGSWLPSSLFGRESSALAQPSWNRGVACTNTDAHRGQSSRKRH